MALWRRKHNFKLDWISPDIQQFPSRIYRITKAEKAGINQNSKTNHSNRTLSLSLARALAIQFLIMSRSYSHGSSHSRGNRSRADSSISVTQASFQDLGLHETAGTHRSSSSSYHSHDQRSPRSAYRRDNIPSNYLQTEYNTASYAPAPPSESFIDPQRLSTNYIPPVAEQSDYLTPQSSSYSRANMG